MRFLAERTQFRRDRVVVPIARKHLLPDCFSAVFSAGGACGGARRRSSLQGEALALPGEHDRLATPTTAAS